MKLSRLALLSVFALASAPSWAESVVTVYSIDGLHDGDNSWYQVQFDAFTKATGITVRYVEGGGGVVVERLAKERTNPQADVLVTAPPPKSCWRTLTPTPPRLSPMPTTFIRRW